MPLLRRSVSAGTLIPNYGAANVTDAQKDQTLFSSKGRLLSNSKVVL
jgi:hypothetical protein